MEAICDDINTPQVISVINSYISDPNEEIISILYWLENNFFKVWFFDIVQEEKIIIPQEIIAFAQQRIQAKKDKNYALADELRNKVKDMWYEIRDTKDWFEIDKI
jgi:cysteinyl-tRNA synthetase